MRLCNKLKALKRIAFTGRDECIFSGKNLSECWKKQLKQSGLFLAPFHHDAHTYWLTSVCNKQITNVTSQSASQWKGNITVNIQGVKGKRERKRERKKHDENNNIKIKIIAKDEELKRTNVTRTSRRATWNADDSDTVAHRIIYTICNPLSLSVGDPSSRRLSHRSAFTRGHNSSTTTTPPPLSSCSFCTKKNSECPLIQRTDVHL